MMSAQKYLETALSTLQKLAETQKNAIRTAADEMISAIISGGTIYAFGASHSFILAEEMVYRTGGLMLINPIYPHGMNTSVRPMTLTSRLERLPGLGKELLSSSPAKAGDVIIIASVSGRNAVAIDMAISARERGLRVIGITSLDYLNKVASRHPSGKKLADFCDIVLDNCVPYGDAAVSIKGFPQKVGPLSTLAGVALVNALVAEVADGLLERGVTPPVFMSANVDGGDEFNEKLLQENKHRIHYMF